MRRAFDALGQAFDALSRTFDALGRPIKGFFGALVSMVESLSRKDWFRSVTFMVTTVAALGIGLLITISLLPGTAWAQGGGGLISGTVSVTCGLSVLWWLDNRLVTINEPPAEVPVRKHDTGDGNCLRFEGDPKAPINLSHRCLICNPKSPKSADLAIYARGSLTVEWNEGTPQTWRALVESTERRSR